MPPETDSPSPDKAVYSVSRLNREVSQLLTGAFPLVWVEGELSNIARPRSGHLYFSLKDATAQVRGAMFRNRNQYLRFNPEDGIQVLIRGRVGLYEPRGDYQLIVEHMEMAGDGALRRAFEELKRRLHAEGLFDESRKQSLPAFPRRLGVITSSSGAALRDVLSVLRRRYPALPVLVYPVPVQGAEAVPAIVRTLRLAERRNDCDVLVLTRGGGSLEDLQAFNDETVARAVATCPIPVVSGVGHEIDFTIADFVADLRAPTPSAAAELVSPDATELQQRLRQIAGGVQRLILERLKNERQALSNLETRLRRLHPQQRLNQHNQRLDELEARMRRAVDARLQQSAARVNHAWSGLLSRGPQTRLPQYSLALAHSQQRLKRAVADQLDRRRRSLTALIRNLDAVSPLATLRRGYSIVTRAASGKPVVEAATVERGEALKVRLAEGELGVQVNRITDRTDDGP